MINSRRTNKNAGWRSWLNQRKEYKIWWPTTSQWWSTGAAVSWGSLNRRHHWGKISRRQPTCWGWTGRTKAHRLDPDPPGLSEGLDQNYREISWSLWRATKTSEVKLNGKHTGEKVTAPKPWWRSQITVYRRRRSSSGNLNRPETGNVNFWIFIWTLSFILNFQGHNKLVEFLRNHIVPSTAVSTTAAPCPSLFTLFPLTLVISALLKLEIYNIVSSPALVTMANQALTTNVTGNVSVELKHLADGRRSAEVQNQLSWGSNSGSEILYVSQVVKKKKNRGVINWVL